MKITTLLFGLGGSLALAAAVANPVCAPINMTIGAAILGLCNKPNETLTTCDLIGEPGELGVKGDLGMSGYTGYQGRDGDMTFGSRFGPDGDDGPPGDQGIEGDLGDQGDPGCDANTWLKEAFNIVAVSAPCGFAMGAFSGPVFTILMKVREYRNRR